MKSPKEKKANGKDYTSSKYQRTTKVLLAVGVGLGFLFAFIAGFGATLSAVVLHEDDVVFLVLGTAAPTAIAAAVFYAVVHHRQERTKRATTEAQFSQIVSSDSRAKPFN
jgi:uncharacterized membrane protein YidH (DUF202 family)